MSPARLLCMLTNKEILKDKVEQKQKELEAQMVRLKADTREAAARQREQIRQHLSELEIALADGWNQMTESASKRVNDWLSKN